jgi:Fe-S-cluster containining protein
MKLTKNKWYVGGLHFECQGCGGCCAGPNSGYIWVTEKEIEFIADFLKQPVEAVKEKYTKRVRFKTTIIEQPDTNDCIFLRKTGGRLGCMIYSVRPNQCRTWPFWTENIANSCEWNETAKKCGGINRGRAFSLEEIESLEKQKTWWLK